MSGSSLIRNHWRNQSERIFATDRAKLQTRDIAVPASMAGKPPAPPTAAALLEKELGAARARHSRRITLRAAAAVIDCLEADGDSTPAATALPGSPGRAHVPHASVLAATRGGSFRAPTNRSIASILRGLIAQIVTLRQQKQALDAAHQELKAETGKLLEQAGGQSESGGSFCRHLRPC